MPPSWPPSTWMTRPRDIRTGASGAERGSESAWRTQGAAPTVALSAAFLYSAPVSVGAQTSNPFPGGADWGSKLPPAQAAERRTAMRTAVIQLF